MSLEPLYTNVKMKYPYTNIKTISISSHRPLIPCSLDPGSTVSLLSSMFSLHTAAGEPSADIFCLQGHMPSRKCTKATDNLLKYFRKRFPEFRL